MGSYVIEVTEKKTGISFKETNRKPRPTLNYYDRSGLHLVCRAAVMSSSCTQKFSLPLFVLFEK